MRTSMLVLGTPLMLAALSCQTAGESPVAMTTRALGAAAPDTVLILDSTVSGGASSREAVFATSGGYAVEVTDAAGWAAKTTADFATYRAIILGDATCTGGVGSIAVVESTTAVWGPAIKGNVIIVGTDPVFHQSQGGDSLTQGSVMFAAAEPGKTGAYINLSCYYHGVASSTPVPVLAPLGTFTVTGVGCFDDAHKVADHPALYGITDATLSSWGCSVHEAFDGFPASFLPLAIARGISGPGSVTFADGSFGIPYILARGETLVPAACGNGAVEAPEECDDGNTTPGDGCSAQCTIELPVCGNGVVEATEECDDGNTAGGDGCSATCALECGNGTIEGSEQCDDGNRTSGDGCSSTCTSENRPPACGGAQAGPSVIWPPNHQLVAISIGGVTDPDGDPVTVTATQIRQDEAVRESGAGSGNTSPDGVLAPLSVRAERNGNPKTPGNGRVYTIHFTAADGHGAQCSGTVRVCVPHDQARPTCVDNGPLHDSTQN